MLTLSFALSVGVFHSPAFAEYRAVLKLATERMSKLAAVEKQTDGLYRLNEQLARCLDSTDPKVRLAALRGFATHSRIGVNYDLAPQLTRLIRHDPVAVIRKEAISLQTSLRDEADVRAIVEALQDPAREVRDQAAYWFARYPVRPDIAVTGLKGYIADAIREPAGKDTVESAGWGVYALRSFGRSADEAVPTVLSATEHPSVEVRRGAIFTLSHIARDREAMAAEFGKRFIHANRKLFDPDRVAALNAAPNLGPAAAVFVPDYLRYLHADLLGEPVPPKGTANPAQDMLWALWKLGPAAKNAGPELVKLVAHADDKHPLRGQFAVCALVVGVTDEADLKVLAKVLAAKDGQEWVLRELSVGDRFPQFRRQADKLCKLIAAEWDTDPPLQEETFRQSKRLAEALGADGAGLLPFLDKITGVAGPPEGTDFESHRRRSEYFSREGQAAAGAKYIRAEIARKKATPKNR